MHVKGKTQTAHTSFCHMNAHKTLHICTSRKKRGQTEQSGVTPTPLPAGKCCTSTVVHQIFRASSLPITLQITNTVSYQQRFKTQHKINQIINSVEKYNNSSGLLQGWTTSRASGAKSHVCTYQVKRTVATLITDCQHADSALC